MTSHSIQNLGISAVPLMWGNYSNGTICDNVKSTAAHGVAYGLKIQREKLLIKFWTFRGFNTGQHH